MVDYYISSVNLTEEQVDKIREIQKEIGCLYEEIKRLNNSIYTIEIEGTDRKNFKCGDTLFSPYTGYSYVVGDDGILPIINICN